MEFLGTFDVAVIVISFATETVVSIVEIDAMLMIETLLFDFVQPPNVYPAFTDAVSVAGFWFWIKMQVSLLSIVAVSIPSSFATPGGSCPCR